MADKPPARRTPPSTWPPGGALLQSAPQLI